MTLQSVLRIIAIESYSYMCVHIPVNELPVGPVTLDTPAPPVGPVMDSPVKDSPAAPVGPVIDALALFPRKIRVTRPNRVKYKSNTPRITTKSSTISHIKNFYVRSFVSILWFCSTNSTSMSP